MITAPDAARDDRFTTERYPLVLFYDGDCSFCMRWVERVRQADRAHRIRFGPKQGSTFAEVARVHPELANVESLVLVKRRADGSEAGYVRSRAVREIIDGLPEFRVFATVLAISPEFLSDLGYRILSKLRGVLFSRWHGIHPALEQDDERYVG